MIVLQEAHHKSLCIQTNMVELNKQRESLQRRLGGNVGVNLLLNLYIY